MMFLIDGIIPDNLSQNRLIIDCLLNIKKVEGFAGDVPSIGRFKPHSPHQKK